MTAKDFLDHCYAGLLLAGKVEKQDPSDEWDLEWIGESRQWTRLMWLQDGLTYKELAQS